MNGDGLDSAGWTVFATLFLALFVYVVARAPAFLVEAVGAAVLGLARRFDKLHFFPAGIEDVLARWVKRGERAAAVVALPVAVALAVDIQDGVWSSWAQGAFLFFAAAVLTILAVGLGLLAVIAVWSVARLGPQGPTQTLAGFAGKLLAVTHKELAAVGLWGRRVRVTENRRWNMVDLQAGWTGRIGFSYPASASLYDPAREVPVEGLDVRHNLGVPWDALALIPDIADPRRRSAAGALAGRVFVAMATALNPDRRPRARRISGTEAARLFEGREAVEVCIGPANDGPVRRPAFWLGFPAAGTGDTAQREAQAKALAETLLAAFAPPGADLVIQRAARWPDMPFPDSPRARMSADCRLEGVAYRCARLGPKGDDVVALLADAWLDRLNPEPVTRG